MTDPRIRCIDCRHYRGSRCHSALSAGLSMIPTRPIKVAEIGPDFANLLQFCSAFYARKPA